MKLLVLAKRLRGSFFLFFSFPVFFPILWWSTVVPMRGKSTKIRKILGMVRGFIFHINWGCYRFVLSGPAALLMEMGKSPRRGGGKEWKKNNKTCTTLSYLPIVVAITNKLALIYPYSLTATFSFLFFYFLVVFFCLNVVNEQNVSSFRRPNNVVAQLVYIFLQGTHTHSAGAHTVLISHTR